MFRSYLGLGFLLGFDAHNNDIIINNSHEFEKISPVSGEFLVVFSELEQRNRNTKGTYQF